MIPQSGLRGSIQAHSATETAISVCKVKPTTVDHPVACLRQARRASPKKIEALEQQSQNKGNDQAVNQANTCPRERFNLRYLTIIAIRVVVHIKEIYSSSRLIHGVSHAK